MNSRAHRPRVQVTADGQGMVGHAGSRLLAELAERSGLDQGLSKGLAPLAKRRRRHDPGRVLVDHYFMTEAPWPSAEGYRVVWVLSSSKARKDAQTRQARIVQASRQLEELRTRLQSPKARIRTKDGAFQAAQAILTELSSPRFIEVKVDEVAEPRFRQVTRGRAGAATTYRRQDRIHIELTWQVLEDRVAYVAKSDGIFPFITNCRDLTLADLLDRYKYQPSWSDAASN